MTADYVPREVFAASLAAAPAAATRLIRLMAERLRRTDPFVGELSNTRAHLAHPPAPDGRPRRRR
jgi:CRP-like cAMP-binding protein